MASGAGQNRLLAPNAFGYTVRAADIAAGNVDSGCILTEGIGMTKWTFTLNQIGSTALSNLNVTVYGTNDRKVYEYMLQHLGDPAAAAGAVTTYPNAFQILPGPSEQSGTGSMANPMTDQIPFFQFSGALVAVRLVASAANGMTEAGDFVVSVEAVP